MALCSNPPSSSGHLLSSSSSLCCATSPQSQVSPTENHSGWRNEQQPKWWESNERICIVVRTKCKLRGCSILLLFSYARFFFVGRLNFKEKMCVLRLLKLCKKSVGVRQGIVVIYWACGMLESKCWLMFAKYYKRRRVYLQNV